MTEAEEHLTERAGMILESMIPIVEVDIGRELTDEEIKRFISEMTPGADRAAGRVWSEYEKRKRLTTEVTENG